MMSVKTKDKSYSKKVTTVLFVALLIAALCIPIFVSIFILREIKKSTNLLFKSPSTQTIKELKKIYLENKEEFTLIAKQFLEQTSIEEITIQLDNHPKCGRINSWEFCGAVWKKEEILPSGEELKRTLNTLDEVLEKEAITRDDYDFYRQFLGKYRFRRIAKLPYIACQSCVDFEEIYNFGRCGLRYDRTGPTLITEKERDDFTSLNKLDTNWYLYCKDWN